MPESENNLESNRYFSIDEVNALIPRMEEHFQKFWAFRQNAQNMLHELRRSLKNSQSQQPKDLAYQQIKQSQAHFLLEQAKKELDFILDTGCAIMDLEMGMVDFPHVMEYEEEEVFLCWKYGEKKIRFWHGLNEDFSERKPLGRKIHLR